MSDRLRSTSDTERIDWIRLYRSQGVGTATFFALLQYFGTAARALEALPELARRGGSKQAPKIAEPSIAERELEALAKLGGTLILAKDPGFPEPLFVLDTVPFLMVVGKAEVLTKPSIGIVGSRNASAAGRRIAQTLATDLGRAGLIVVSGLARGIDGAAHEGALATGTVAALAGGVDVIYPPEHAKLYGRILETGCVISEMPPGTEPQASYFPRRNRLISGMALGVVVVEAAARSGSLITARLALEQGREVFAVPGSPLDPRSQGANGLIRQGATLTESAADVLDGLGVIQNRQIAESGPKSDPTPPQAADEKTLVETRKQVESALGPTPVPVDEIIRQCQVSAAIVSMVLLELELAGRLERHPGGKVAKVY
ncbi:MAG TPA: DNA-processing protein DprA [Magnetospirillaceae bacterium]|jgi:DNA processing protein